MKKKTCFNGHEIPMKDDSIVCPVCGAGMEIKKLSYEDKVRESCKVKGRLNDSLPRLPWFGEIENNEDVARRGEKWPLDEILLLEEEFHNYGMVDAKFWKDIAETIFERSVYSIEHALRFVIAANFGLLKLDEIFS